MAVTGRPAEPESSAGSWPGSLAQRLGLRTLGEALSPRQQWQPFPTAHDRPAWQAVDAELSGTILRRAEAERGRSWPVLSARLFAEYTRTGDRLAYEAPYRERRAALHRFVLAECLTGSGRFLDDVVDLVWAICEETSWSYPATSHPPELEAGGTWDGALPDPEHPVVDLFSAETGSTLAWTRYLLDDVLAEQYPRVPARVDAEIQRRLLVPYRTIDEWRWLRRRADGRPPNNWNPWIHSNLLAAALLVEADRYQRAALVARIVRGLDAFVDGYGEDGGCDEGVSYFWQAGARLFEALDMLRDAVTNHNSGDAVTVMDDPLLAEIARFVPRMHIGADRYVNSGDGASRQRRGGELLYRFGAAVGAPDVQAHALAMREFAEPADVDGRDPLHRILAALFDREYAEAPPAQAPLPRESWLPSIEVLTCRSRAGQTDGLFLTVKAGHNGESHGHNDIGSFTVALDGVPALIDVGVGVYTRTTFSSERFGIWTMRGAYHNVPVIDGVEQEDGREFRARDVVATTSADGFGTSGLSADLASAYPPRAGVLRWVRRVRLDRAVIGPATGSSTEIVVEDDYALDHEPDRLALHLMSWSRPEPVTTSEGEPGQVLVPVRPGRALRLVFDPAAFRFSSELIPTDDARLADAWGESVHRGVLEVVKPGASGTLRVSMQPLDVPIER